ncbi:MAG: bifunctional (p)ppGpp synthetase/guanosine-3',5'-bis(diphosphate) 3'-pyrophosphohydrolase [Acidobacteria bacterium]|nr:bifunctional (p)ppGpp synthetase/guanosine-3',5'-bis(diphosphate) 3'-pyrophosphohydrolase [Acidobacteriota bacterium]
MEERRDEEGSRRRGVLARLRTVDPPVVQGLDNLARILRATNAKADLKLIQRAYEFAAASHRDQFRASGERFIEHPLGVAEILAELGLDTTTIVAALLHDVVEDTPLTLEEIEREFGAQTALIIDGVTKLDRITFHSREQHQAENLRKMIVAMARDIRVLMIKLADRLHNMRTVGHLPRDKQEMKARETLDIYSPLAHRLGIHQIKWQLEDLAFATLYPKRFEEIIRMVEERQPERAGFIQKVIGQLEGALRDAKIRAEVSGRPKHYWSIYQKMVKRDREFDDIYDLIGVRVTVDTVRDCYGALGVVHALWKPIPGRFKDYIAIPKFNMYRSLHTGVAGPDGKALEIQIRTQTMHRTAEYGIAAHWKYKEGRKGERADADLGWLRQILDWQRELADPREFMESLKIDLYQDEVFVFTPKGDVHALARGATPIDFAYAIHTEVGHRCVGARVNGRLVPLDCGLQSGDTVEVLTSKAKGAGPSRDWLAIVRTPRARNKVRQWFSRERREDAIEKGREDLIRELRRAGLPSQRLMGSAALSEVASELKFPSVDAMEAAVGDGHLSCHTVVLHLRHGGAEEEEEEPAPPEKPVRLRPPSEQGVRVRGADDLLVRLARCCTPVPRDSIVGFVTRGRGVSVHRVDCPNGRALAKESERSIEVEWDSERQASFLVTILVEAIDRTKLLRDTATAISELGVNILSASSTTNPRTRTAMLRFTVELAEAGHLDHILSAVRRVESVYDAYRLIPGHSRR